MPAEIAPKSMYALYPWECRYNKNHSEIRAYVEASGTWETVLTVHPTSGLSHEAMAKRVLTIINDNQKNQHILAAARNALELCLEERGLTFTSEQEIESVVRRIRDQMIA